MIIGTKAKGSSSSSPKMPKPYEGEPDGDEESEPKDEGPEQGYGDVLSRIAGIAEEDKEDFVDALKGFVRACMRKAKDGDL